MSRFESGSPARALSAVCSNLISRIGNRSFPGPVDAPDHAANAAAKVDPWLRYHRALSRISGSAKTMAKQVITLLTDDLDGGDADRTVEFGLDGVNYTIDLSEANAGKLRKVLNPFLD